jgi:hypothetical protein
MSGGGRVTGRADLHAEVGIPACYERLRMTHAATAGTVVYKVNSFNRKLLQ